MKLIFTLIFCNLLITAAAQRCLTIEYTGQQTSGTTKALRGEGQASSRDTLQDEVITIPVVVHILYNKSEQNISDEQVMSQLKVLNEDYRRLNKDAANTPDVFKQVAADTRIQFCLAKTDPDGRPTTGIIHKYTSEGQFLADDAVKFSKKGGDDAWDATRYLNLWVCNLFGRTLGYAVSPGGPADRDGVVITYSAFGTIGRSGAYSKGRTATHEVGHWLGLRHIWGDSLCGDDGIADTPPQETSNSNCPSFPHVSSCSANSYGDMFMNFMDFTDDACMNMFTEGQKIKMRSVFAKGGARNSFLSANACEASAEAGPLPGDTQEANDHVKIMAYPNPFTTSLIIKGNEEKNMVGKKIELFDISGKMVYSATAGSLVTTIHTGTLTKGIYILKISGKESSQVYKVVKQ